MYHVSILGLGLIGSRIARHMAGMGDKVTVWNRTPREDFPEAVPTPADAARASKIIQLYLKDRNACLEVFEQMRGALTPEHIIVSPFDERVVPTVAKAVSDACLQSGYYRKDTVE